MFSEIKTIADQVRAVSGINYSEWQTLKNILSLPAFVIQEVFQEYERITSTDPAKYRIRWTIECFIIVRADIDETEFDTLCENVLKVGRVIVDTDLFSGARNFNFSDFEGVQRTIVNGQEILLFPFQMNFLTTKVF